MVTLASAANDTEAAEQSTTHATTNSKTENLKFFIAITAPFA